MDPRWLLREGEQYVLDLFPEEPWHGRSPRALTRVGKGLFLRQEPPPGDVLDELDPRQLDMWRHRRGTEKRVVERSSAAPLLLPLRLKKGRRPSRKVLYDGG